MSTAFVVGATGAVGSELVKLLADSSKFSKVVLLARRSVDAASGDKFVQKTVDFDKLEENSDDVRNLDVAFCALGTTRGKSGADGFYKVDHDYVMSAAKLAKENGVKQFVLVSSGSADDKSRFLYLKTKGEVEKEIGELNFEKFVIMRPGLIETKRDEFRFGEFAASVVLKPLRLVSNKFSSSATEIAQAMINATQTEESGKHIWDNVKIIEEAKKYSA
uniref:Protein HTATIP2 n=1 Tax=Caenorhabditis tropicalis TaxID=1561998 RepID=A0A1I7TRY7_9PELO